MNVSSLDYLNEKCSTPADLPVVTSAGAVPGEQRLSQIVQRLPVPNRRRQHSCCICHIYRVVVDGEMCLVDSQALGTTDLLQSKNKQTEMKPFLSESCNHREVS